MKNKSYEEIDHLVSNDFAHPPRENIDQMYDTVESTINKIFFNFIDEDLFVNIIINHKKRANYWLCERYIILKHYFIDHNSKKGDF